MHLICTLDHILNNLSTSNVPTYLTKILRSYLNHRTVGFEFNNKKIIPITLLGCPQGSCFGPLLWNLLINPIFNEFNRRFQDSCILAFADDFVLISSANSRRDLEEINKTIQFFNDYCRNINLTLSIPKTKAMCFAADTRRRRPIFKLLNNIIQIVDNFKYLGIVVDWRLNFISHLEYLGSQISQFTAKTHLVNYNYWEVHKSLLRVSYHSVVLSKILYGSPIYYNRLNSHGLRKLSKINRIFLLKLANAYRSTSTSALHAILGISPISDLIIKFITKFGCIYASHEVSFKFFLKEFFFFI